MRRPVTVCMLAPARPGSDACMSAMDARRAVRDDPVPGPAPEGVLPFCGANVGCMPCALAGTYMEACRPPLPTPAPAPGPAEAADSACAAGKMPTIHWRLIGDDASDKDPRADCAAGSVKKYGTVAGGAGGADGAAAGGTGAAVAVIAPAGAVATGGAGCNEGDGVRDDGDLVGATSDAWAGGCPSASTVGTAACPCPCGGGWDSTRAASDSS